MESIEVLFPVAGLDVSSGFNTQRPLTTPDAVNVRSRDVFQERYRGGSRNGLAKYPNDDVPGTGPIQHLAQIVITDADYFLSSFENFSPSFIPDSSTNNFPNGNPPGSVPDGQGIRNPGTPGVNGRDIPLRGNGNRPTRTRPRSIRRRVEITPSVDEQYTGSPADLNIFLMAIPGETGIASQTVTIKTFPPGRSGDGQSVTTNGSGISSLAVQENSFEGLVTYQAQHNYTLSGRNLTATGMCQIRWLPNYALAMVSTDGSALPADGVLHNLVATLTNVGDGSPAEGKKLRLLTSPKPRVGTGSTGTTDSSGQVAFHVSDTTDEVVTYTAKYYSQRQSAISSDPVPITWGSYNPLIVLDFSDAQNGYVQNCGFSVSITADILADGGPGEGITVTLSDSSGQGTGMTAVSSGGVVVWENVPGTPCVGGSFLTVTYSASSVSPGVIDSVIPGTIEFDGGAP